MVFLVTHLASIKAKSSYHGGVNGGTVAGGDAAAQQEHFVQWSVTSYFGQRGFGDHSVLGEGADAQKLEYLLPVKWDPARAIRQNTHLCVLPWKKQVRTLEKKTLRKTVVVVQIAQIVYKHIFQAADFFLTMSGSLAFSALKNVCATTCNL